MVSSDHTRLNNNITFNAVFTGTSVMKITATDADEPNNPNSQIAYSLLEQNPPHDMFEIRKDGTIYVKNSALDREVQN